MIVERRAGIIAPRKVNLKRIKCNTSDNRSIFSFNLSYKIDFVDDPVTIKDRFIHILLKKRICFKFKTHFSQ